MKSWIIIVKKLTCPYCHKKVDIKQIFPNCIERSYMMYGKLLDWLRWLVCQPLFYLIMICCHYILLLKLSFGLVHWSEAGLLFLNWYLVPR